jgi:hypothetical protein
MRGMVALEAGSLGESAGGFFAGEAAVDFDDLSSGSVDEGDLGTVVAALGTEIRFKHDGGTVGREGPEKFHGCGADSAGEFDIARSPLEGGEERLLDVVLGEERKAKALASVVLPEAGGPETRTMRCFVA